MSESMAKPRTMIDLDEFERRLRRPLSANAEGDPLAELARLVGEQKDQNDPFDEVFNHHLATRSPSERSMRERSLGERPFGERSLPERSVGEATRPEQRDEWNFPQSAAPQPRLARRNPSLNGDFAAIEAGLRGSIQPELSNSPAHHASHAPEDEIGDHHHGEWTEADENPEDFADEAYLPPRSRRPLYITAAIILVGLTGIGVSFALKRPSGDLSEIATIRAADGPIKVQADTSSTDKLDQTASILDNSPQPAPVSLVDRVEQPLDTNPPTGRLPKVVTLGSSGASTVPVPPPPSQTVPMGVSADGLGDLIEPKRVRTIPLGPDGSPLAPDSMAASGAVAPKASTPKTNSHVATTPKSSVLASNQDASKGTQQDADDSDDAARNHNAQNRPLKIAAKDPDTKVADTAEPAGKGGFSVQLAAPPTEDQARDSLAHFAKQYSAIIGGHHLGYHRAVVGDKAVFRVRVSGLSSFADATALCEKLKAAGGSCFPAKD